MIGGMTELTYGDHPEQVADLHVPDGEGPWPGVVLWHGGGFRADYTRAMMAPFIGALNARGVAVLNATYRRLDTGGGFPETFDDALAAADVLAAHPEVHGLPAGLGYSAGAPLALHAAHHRRLRRVVAFAGLTGLALAARAGGPASDVHRLMGAGPDEAPERYAAVDPMANQPGVPLLVLHPAQDASVPVAMARAYAAHTGGELVEVPGAGHYDLAALLPAAVDFLAA